MISIEIDAKQLKRLRESVGKAKTKFGRELAAAINKVAKQTQTDMGKKIRTVAKIKAAVAKKSIQITRASAVTPVGRIVLDKHNRTGLQHFGARHTKAGVTYQISPQGGRKTIVGAFMGPRPGVLAPKLNGGVFKRVGKARHPIVKLYGVSSFGAYAKNNFEEPQVVFIQQKMKHEMERRINVNILRASGLVSQ